jgi:3-hydroxybutyryl-CoA dehydrogenase
LGKRALVLNDRPGGLVLRTLAQLANAAADAIDDQVAAGDAIDRALVHGANYPFGPLAWAETAGFGRVVEVLDRIASETGETMYRPSEYLRRAAWTAALS